MTLGGVTTVSEVSFTSTPGLYFALTRSRAVYVIDLSDPDATPAVTRFGSTRKLLFDGELLPGVMDLHFDVHLGTGRLMWWKADPATRRISPGDVYVCTVRRTSTPVWIGRTLAPSLIDIAALVRAIREEGKQSPANESPKNDFDG
jgi:hypothetical protein